MRKDYAIINCIVFYTINYYDLMFHAIIWWNKTRIYRLRRRLESGAGESIHLRKRIIGWSKQIIRIILLLPQNIWIQLSDISINVHIQFMYECVTFGSRNPNRWDIEEHMYVECSDFKWIQMNRTRSVYRTHETHLTIANHVLLFKCFVRLGLHAYLNNLHLIKEVYVLGTN